MIDFDALTAQILEGAARGLGRGAKLVERRAKQRAPVRNIFGHGYRFRAKTMAELATDIRFIDTKTIESMGQTGLGRFGTRWIGPKRVRADMREREVNRALQHLAAYEEGDDTLTRQGAHEVRSMRAAYTVGKKTTVGGRLRGEIYSTNPRSVGEGTVEAWVISPTRYAKYMEFGTRHNRAHPFLRPALLESRDEIVAQIAEAVRQASRKGVGNVNLEIEVRL